jgi:hypothetical protein
MTTATFGNAPTGERLKEKGELSLAEGALLSQSPIGRTWLTKRQ